MYFNCDHVFLFLADNPLCLNYDVNNKVITCLWGISGRGEGVHNIEEMYTTHMTCAADT